MFIQGSAMADKKFTDEAVKAHNDYRKRHQAAPLSHAKDLSAQAQKWADHLAATDSFQHSDVTLKGVRLGENIAMKWSSRPDAYGGQCVRLSVSVCLSGCPSGCLSVCLWRGRGWGRTSP